MTTYELARNLCTARSSNRAVKNRNFLFIKLGFKVSRFYKAFLGYLPNRKLNYSQTGELAMHCRVNWYNCENVSAVVLLLSFYSS
jgi:hypothetical protein